MWQCSNCGNVNPDYSDMQNVWLDETRCSYCGAPRNYQRPGILSSLSYAFTSCFWKSVLLIIAFTLIGWLLSNC